ncbi:MAG TPA: phosphotransferase [Streptosporangiaceae bacterium]|nr:phosphotransferase [Streptosporangiaceae bacterium]
MTRSFPTDEQLADVSRAAFGNGRRLDGVTRLRGGTKKGVYRAAFADGGTAIVYVWDAAEDYWPGAADGADGADRDHAEPLSHPSGLELFLAAHGRLDGVGVRVPEVYLAGGRERFGADVAVVEDVAGPNLLELMEDDPRRAEPVLRQLGDAVAAMHAVKGPGFGKVVYVDRGGVSKGASCEAVILDRALADLAEGAERDERLAAVRDDIALRLRSRAAQIRPRADHRLIHGELGPEHVLVDGQGRPVIIDIEGLMYFDVEWDHVFLRLRYQEDYRFLDRDDMDPARLRLYALAMHLSLVTGPLRLLDGDFPEREGMLQIVEHNLGRVLAQGTES